MPFSPTVEQWRNVLAPRARALGIPLDFLLAWLQIESGGNPCSVGFHGEQDPNDGLFKFEAGISQAFFSALTRAQLFATTVQGVSLTTLRAPCVGDTQRQARSLTAAEIAANVNLFLADVTRKINVARQQVGVTRVNWPTTSEDFWMLVKLQHGLPCVSRSFLAPAQAAGRTKTFRDFATFVLGLDRANYTRFTTAAGCGTSMARFFGSAGLENVLDNAIRAGAGQGTTALSATARTASPAKKFATGFAAVAGLVGLGWITWRLTERTPRGAQLGLNTRLQSSHSLRC